MTYSLIIPIKETENIVDGYWVQDCVRGLDVARQLAKETSKLNHDQRIVVTEKVSSTTPILSIHYNLKKV